MAIIKYGKYKDLTGVKFNRLTVIKETERRSWITKNGKKRSNRRVLCKCDCGNETEVDIQVLTRSNDPVFSCGCYGRERQREFKDLTGMQFGKWTVLKFDEETYNEKLKNKENNLHYWICQCECGEVRSVRGGDLTFGKSKECGQCNLNSVKIGSKFDRLTVTKLYEEDGYYYADCKCECGGERNRVHRSSLYCGLTRSCGCVSSFGEEKINDFLNENKFFFDREVSIDGCVHIKNLKFDFVVYKDKDFNNILACIEYDGKYHYEEDFRFESHDTLENIQARDKTKNKFCSENSIRLIRIPYWDYDNIENILSEAL